MLKIFFYTFTFNVRIFPKLFFFLSALKSLSQPPFLCVKTGVGKTNC